MTWTPDQKILNRARAIYRNLMQVEGYLRQLIGEAELLSLRKLPQTARFTWRDLKRFRYANDRQLQQGAKLKKLLDLLERKR